METILTPLELKLLSSLNVKILQVIELKARTILGKLTPSRDIVLTDMTRKHREFITRKNKIKLHY